MFHLKDRRIFKSFFKINKLLKNALEPLTQNDVKQKI